LILPYSSRISEKEFTYLLTTKRGQNEINADELNRGTPSLPKESRKPLRINYSAELEKWRAEKSERLNKITRENRFKSVTSLYKGEQLPPIVVPSAEEKRKIGSLVHSALEAIAMEPAKKDNIRETVEALNLEGLTETALERVVEMVNKALETPILQRALKAKALQKEYPIVMEENGTIISGRVDLAFVEGDGIVVVDYKTDEVTTEEDAKRRVKDVYITQGEIYSKIIKKATKTAIKEVYFLFLHPTPPIAVNILEF
jgi:ATP-dependent exoDNAse (exonuclease V) beta subunit